MKASRLCAATVLALALFIVILLLLVGAPNAWGRDPAASWVCGDTRYTQLVPRGWSVVGPPVSPPPGCAS